MVKISGIAYNQDFTVVANGTITFAPVGDSLTEPVSAQTDREGHFGIFIPVGKWNTDKIIAVTEIEID